MNVLALCAGVGGLELGVHLAEPRSRVVCYVEREAYAAAILAARMAKGCLAPAPIWSDLTTFDSAAWRGVVDCITAGFPCQPFSCQGLRKGTDDERWIWPYIAEIIRVVGPRYVFLENVPGLIVSGLGLVLGSLASLGFDAEWDVFSAASMGAPHIRKRIFILAYPTGCGLQTEGVQQTFRRQALEPVPSLHLQANLWGANAHDLARVDDGLPSRMDRIRASGNGVVPLVGAFAFRTLTARAGLRFRGGGVA